MLSIITKTCPVCGASNSWSISVTFKGKPIVREFLPEWDMMTITCSHCGFGESIYDPIDEEEEW